MLSGFRNIALREVELGIELFRFQVSWDKKIQNKSEMNQFPKKKKFKNVKITVNQSANSRDVEVKGQEKISVKYEQFAKDVQAINNDNVEVQILDFSNLPFVKFLKKP